MTTDGAAMMNTDPNSVVIHIPSGVSCNSPVVRVVDV